MQFGNDFTRIMDYLVKQMPLFIDAPVGQGEGQVDVRRPLTLHMGMGTYVALMCYWVG
jgi:hypothetical protein